MCSGSQYTVATCQIRSLRRRPQRKLVIEPQVDPLKAEKMFTEFVEQLVKRCVLRALSVSEAGTLSGGEVRQVLSPQLV